MHNYSIKKQIHKLKKRFCSGILIVALCFSSASCGNTNAKEEGKGGASAATQTDAVTEPYPDGIDISIVMIGDLLMHERVQLTGQLSDGTYNYDHLFANIKDDLEAADCAVLNNEVIYGGNDLGLQGYPNFSARDETADAVAKSGIDVVLHASNHTLDWGVSAIEHCMSYWEEAHPEIEVLGIHPDKYDASQIYVYEKNDFKIAMLNYTYGLNGFILPDDKQYMIDMLTEENKNKIIYDIRKARDIADAVVVFPHWGTEYNLGTDEMQREWAGFFADEGVTLVLGDHPHVVEPVEWITGKNGNKMLCYYSMGNFVSTQEIAETMLGLMAKVTLHKDKDGTVSIKTYGIEPLVTHRVMGEKAITTYRLRDYTEELAAQNTITEVDSRWSIDFMKNICRDVFGNLYNENGISEVTIEEKTTQAPLEPVDETELRNMLDEAKASMSAEDYARYVLAEGAEANGMTIDDYPSDAVELLSFNSELDMFYYHYFDKYGTENVYGFDEYLNEDGVPLVMQWDERWGYHEYGSNLLGLAGCGPTCLSMVALYLKHDASLDPVTIADFAVEKGYRVDGFGTTWDLMTEGAPQLGIGSKEIPLDESVIAEELSAGHPVIFIVGAGDFTLHSHYILATGYEDGYLTINDPNSRSRSAQKWKFTDIGDQINNLWAFYPLD